jgi:DNA-binding response OmpR family regulator
MKKCIYVVEDNRSLREVIEFLLLEEEYQVKSCQNLKEFWLQMQNHLPDMVVLDVLLPDGNGMEICTKLKQNAKTHTIPVMMMSANNFLNKVKSKCHADAYINKPFDINDFIDRIEKYAPN